MGEISSQAVVATPQVIVSVAPAPSGVIGSLFKKRSVFGKPSIKKLGKDGFIHLGEGGSHSLECLVGLKLGSLSEVFSHDLKLVKLAVLDGGIIL